MANTTRGYSFEDFSKTQPGQPLPGNRLDIELDRIYNALSALEDFSKVSFSPDGTLRGHTIGEQHLKAGLLAPLIQQVQAKIDAVLPLLDARDKSTQHHLIQAKQALAEQHTLLDQTRSLNDQTEQAMAKAVLAAADAVQSRSRAENSLSNISARAQDAETSAAAARIAEDMSYRWAEKLDGPVFLPNGADPVDDGFYSSKFWALWTKTQVDMGSWWYLGVHPAPPTTANDGGPLQPGMWYFDSSDGQTYIWNGTDWDAITGDTGEVLSVFGRKGSVIAQAPDYEAFYADKDTTAAALADRYTKAQVDASQAAQDTAIGTKLTQAQVDARVRVIGDPVWVQYKDNWVAGTYEKWAIVGHNGGTWIATTTTTQEPGPASSQWDTLGGAGGAFVGATPPPSPAQGQLWYCTVNPVGLYVWYTDADSSQWVSTGGAGGGISQDAADNRYLKLTGGTLSGVLNVASYTSVAPLDAVNNSNLLLLRFDKSINGALFHVASTDEVIIQKRDVDGLTAKAEIRLGANGATFSRGALILANDSAAADAWSNLSIQRPSHPTGVGAIQFKDTGNVPRWVLQHGPGADADLRITRFSAAGAYQDVPLIIGQATTQITGGLAVVGRAASSTALTLRKVDDAQYSVISHASADGVSRWAWVHNNSLNGSLILQRNDAAGAAQSFPVTFGTNGDIAFVGSTNIRSVLATDWTILSIYRPSTTTRGLLRFCDVTNQPRWILNHLAGADGDFALERLSAVGVSQSTPITAHANGYITLATSTLFVTGIVEAQGYRSRQGTAGAIAAPAFNFAWVTPGVMQMWADTAFIGNVSVTSDYRTKKDVEPLASQWENLKNLRPVSYTRAEFQPPGTEPHLDEDGNPVPLFTSDDEIQWGFVAHELQEDLIPSAATGTKDAPDTVQAPNPFTLLAVTVRALQEAVARIEQLETQVAQWH